MTGPFKQRSITLGFHPTARGFGWTAFEGPFALFSSGLYTPQGDKNVRCLTKVAELIENLKPEAFVLEAFDRQSSLRSERIRRLCVSVVNLAADKGCEIAVFTRGDIQACFSSVARTRDEIAATVVRHIPALEPRLPKRRSAANSEDKRLAIFCAAALVLTHYHNGAAALLDDLRNAA